MDYFSQVAQTLEKRVEKLEHKLTELATRVARRKPQIKDWRRTFGLSRGDAGFKEMTNLGRQYRKSLRDKGNGAGS